MASEQSLKTIKRDKDYNTLAKNNSYSNIQNNINTICKISSNKSSNAAMVSSMIKHESVDAGLINNTVQISKSHTHNSQVPTASCIANATNVASGGCNTSSTANSSPKMGSRRIFPPQFKLQVLESYRNDSDCKGNQRATARKYNIHRRQIQKWLQCEPNLRSSVANINQNNVKHQFHNISHHHGQQQHLQLSITAPANSSHYNQHHKLHQHHHEQQHQRQLSLDTARHCVALNSLSVPTPVGGTSQGASAQGVLSAANLAAAVAAAGAMTIVNTTCTSTSATVSPLRPTAIGGSSGSTVSPSMLQPHHHHYSMPYTHTPASVPVSVPILAHHIPPQHQHFHHYQYQNLSHQLNLLTQPQQPSAFQPSASLPVTVLSATASAKINAVNATATGDTVAQGEGLKKNDELRELSTAPTTTATTLTNATGNSYVHSNAYMYNCYEHDGGSCSEDEAKYKSCQKYHFTHQGLLVAPMDLSLRPRRQLMVDNECVTASRRTTSDLYLCTDNEQQSMVSTKDNLIVDLTFRKRKVATNPFIDEQPQKLARLADGHTITDTSAYVKAEVIEYDDAEEEEESDEEVEVDVEEKTPPSKPIKLFKPYLLDDDDGVHEKQNLKTCSGNGSEQRETIIWSHHPTCMSPNSYDSRQGSSRGSHFQSPPLEKYTFPAGSSYFPCNNITEKHSVLSTESVPELSPASLRCPKGSPVSGYESSSSTYSDSSSRREPRGNTCSSRAYSINLKLHPIYNDTLILNESHVQRWLDQESNKTPPVPNATIALFV